MEHWSYAEPCLRNTVLDHCSLKHDVKEHKNPLTAIIIESHLDTLLIYCVFNNPTDLLNYAVPIVKYLYGSGGVWFEVPPRNLKGPKKKKQAPPAPDSLCLNRDSITAPPNRYRYTTLLGQVPYIHLMSRIVLTLWPESNEDTAMVEQWLAKEKQSKLWHKAAAVPHRPLISSTVTRNCNGVSSTVRHRSQKLGHAYFHTKNYRI